MKIFFIVCFMLGSLVVFQPSINRMVLEARGLSFAALLNGSIIFSAAALFFLVISWWPERFPSTLRFIPQGSFCWWYILPGLMGFALVLLVPLMINNLGAFSTVAIMMLGQVTTSLLWDAYAETSPLTTTKLVGVVLLVMGAYFSYKPSG